MLERKMEAELARWKARPDKMCLLLGGARQVGKTFSVRRFGRDNYENVIELNFEKNPAYRQAFEGSLEVDDILARISLVYPGARFEPGRTLLFLDEVQSCPGARTALKFLTEDGRFDVVATGSLLGIRYKEESSLPVGYVDHLEMHSLDFEEYLWARGYSHEAVGTLASYAGQEGPVPDAVHESMMGMLREHIVVGGMPKAVQTFVDTRNFAEVLRVQRGILEDYRGDIAKYAEGAEKAKARACFDSIPRQLARDYKKFSYAVVQPKAGARKYGGSLQWLYDAGIVNFCHNLEAISLPLEGNAIDNNFKVYLRDTGLLVAMLEDGSQADIFNGNLGIYKGAVYENIVGDIFAKQGRPLYFYGEGAHFEIDFVIRQGGEAVPVEVKSAANRKAKSLKSVLDRGLASRGMKLSTGNRGKSGCVDTYPLYLAPFIEPDHSQAR